MVLDAVIFGATGFTGRRVLQRWCHVAAKEDKNGDQWTVGIAGRSRSRLEEVLEWLGPTKDKIEIIIADVDDPQSLTNMCQQTKLLLNCAGPFRKYGEPVVATCVTLGVDYLDVCGEPEFMETMEAKYFQKAEKTNALIVSACGFDSVPADLGVIHAARQFAPPGAPNSVESFLSLKAERGMRANFGTWESLVEGVGKASDLKKLRNSRPKSPLLPILGPRLKRNENPFFDIHTKSWSVPFPGADASVVRRTTQTIFSFQKKFSGQASESFSGSPDSEENFQILPVHYAAYLTLSSRKNVFLLSVFGGLFKILSPYEWGRKLLLRFPEIFSFGVFSKKGPSIEQMEASSFSLTFLSKGYTDESHVTNCPSLPPNRQVVTSVTGPEPGYVATPIILVECAFVVLKNRNKLLKGGVYTPGTVFGYTDLQNRLHRAGITFSVISETAL